ncbi:MAG: tetratricopeptide repeat protein [Muribaculaceae bacterium]|nr:tetratricopeptide repeat protein [Muribaculaceae bacterium]
MSKKILISMSLCATLLLGTGCSKQLTQLSSDNFNVNPSPLEVEGSLVPATITGQIPAKYFQKNAEVTITPYLVYGDKEKAGNALVLQGEKVRGNHQVVPYETGATVALPVSYEYEPEMMKSNLWLDFNVKQGNKTYVLPRVKVAEGVLATATLATAATVTPAIATDNFQRIINEKVEADIMFLINQTNVRADQINTAAMKEFNGAVKEANDDARREIKEINISSYASPEGGVKLNTRIAEGREQNTKKYLDKTLKENSVDEFGELTSDFTAQDWEGFQRLVAESNIQDKELILSVLSMYKDPEEREREIRNLSSVFDQLAQQVLPQLRYSRLSATIEVIGKSDKEIQEAYANDPKSLSVEELLYAATLTDDNSKKAEIYSTAAEIYPNDYRTFNNLGMCQFADGDYDAAERNFNKAAKLNPESKEVQMNQGLISLLDKDYDTANEKFGNAAGVKELNDALGVYYINQGDLNAAKSTMGNSASNNAALAQILTKDYNAAKNTLVSIEKPDATTYYLMAVLGARTNNEQMVTSNLRQAVKLDKELAKRALNDKEFSKFNLSNVL